MLSEQFFSFYIFPHFLFSAASGSALKSFLAGGVGGVMAVLVSFATYTVGGQDRICSFAVVMDG
jgi:hypothetical protein